MVKNKRSYSTLTNNSDNEEINKEKTLLDPCENKEKREKKNFTLFCYLIKTLKITIGIYGIYFLWIFLHYGSAHLYTTYCVPNTLYGMIISPILTTTPHCQGLRWIIYNGGNQINNMWVTFGSWICLKLLM